MTKKTKIIKRTIDFATAREADTNVLVGILEITGLKTPLVSADRADWEVIRDGAEFIIRALDEEEQRKFEEGQPDLFEQYEDVSDEQTFEDFECEFEEESEALREQIHKARLARNARIGHC